MNKGQTGLIIAGLTLTTILLAGTMGFLSGQSAEETTFFLGATMNESKKNGNVLGCTGKLLNVDPNSGFVGFVIVSDLTTQTQVAQFTMTNLVNATNPVQEGGTEGVDKWKVEYDAEKNMVVLKYNVFNLPHFDTHECLINVEDITNNVGFKGRATAGIQVVEGR